MIIDIDTDAILSICMLVDKADESLQEASTSIRALAEHNNWNCRERDSVIERIAAIKFAQERISEDFMLFEKTLKNAAQQLEEIRLAVAKGSGQLESAIGEMVAIDTPKSAQPGAFQSIISEIQTEDRLESYEIASGTASLRICDFPNINLNVTEVKS